MGLFTFVPELLVVVDDRHRKAGRSEMPNCMPSSREDSWIRTMTHDLFARALFESHDWISRIMQDKWFLLPANQTGASRHLAQAPPAISLFLLLPAGKESYLFPFPLSKLRLRQLQLFHALSHI